MTKEETMDAPRTEADAFIDHDWRDCNCALHGPRTFDYHTHAQYRSEEQRCDVCIAKGRADALREAAERVRGLGEPTLNATFTSVSLAAVLAILEPIGTTNGK
jgi:hypothetical protein